MPQLKIRVAAKSMHRSDDVIAGQARPLFGEVIELLQGIDGDGDIGLFAFHRQLGTAQMNLNLGGSLKQLKATVALSTEIHQGLCVAKAKLLSVSLIVLIWHGFLVSRGAVCPPSLLSRIFPGYALRMSQSVGSSFTELVQVMATLLGPKGCPWDREQSIASLRPYLIEECFELVDAMDRGDVDNHKEELGDLLFQIVFQSALQSQDGNFDVDQVIAGIRDKLVHRHPHVFGDTSVEDAEQVLTRWEEIKAAEKLAKGVDQRHLLDAVPKAMPSLSRAQKISNKVARVGFDWANASDCLAKVREETSEVEEAMSQSSKEHVAEEIGDLLFATVGLARKLGVDADAALRAANRKFEARFRRVEDRLAESGSTPADSTLEEMDTIWEQIKHLSES